LRLSSCRRIHPCRIRRLSWSSDRAVPDIIHPSIHHPLRLRLVRSFVLLVETRRLQPPDALAEAASTIYFFDDLNQSSSRQVPTFTLLRLVSSNVVPAPARVGKPKSLDGRQDLQRTRGNSPDTSARYTHETITSRTSFCRSQQPGIRPRLLRRRPRR
jgi:hypothetical protein